MREKQTESPVVTGIVNFFVKFLFTFDIAVLVAVSVGLIGLAIVVLYEGFVDLLAITAHAPIIESTHSPTHALSDFMFVLIIMELMRQVMRQLQHLPFTLNPFLFIGVIASIRGILIVLMALAMGEMEWISGVVRLGVYTATVLALIFCYYLNTKTEKIDHGA